MDAVINFLNRILWGSSDFPLVFRAGLLGVLLVGVGVFFTVALRGVQFRQFGHMWGVFIRSVKPEHPDAISGFQAFATSLAARVGAGNIGGVAIALTLGGPGAIFWMWVVALIGMATAMVEATLAQVFKQRDTADGANVFRGGPAYYMQRGLGKRWMGIVFSILLILAFPFVFNALQSNTMASALENGFGIEPQVTGIFVALFTGIIIFGGIKRISKFAELVVPFMAIAYIIMGLVVVAMNITEVPAVLADIVTSAFGPREAAGGFAGYAVAAAITSGLKRGLFSNEAGLGSAPNAAATADVQHPASQGYVQALGVFVDTIIICTATAFIILVSGVYDPAAPGKMAGASLTAAAVADGLGAWTTWLMTVLVFVFAFSSVLGNYVYAEINLFFLGVKESGIVLFRMLVLAGIAAGGLATLSAVWALADVAMGLMAIVNLIAIVLLGKWAFAALRDYTRQAEAGRDPVFVAEEAGLPGELPGDIWNKVPSLK